VIAELDVREQVQKGQEQRDEVQQGDAKGDAKGEGIAATVEFDQGEPNAFLLLDVETPAPGKGSLFARFVNAKGERFHTVQLSLDSLRRTR
jgi:hypothetical protein